MSGFFFLHVHVCVCVQLCVCLLACEKKVAVSLDAYDFVYVRPSEDISMRGWDCAC